jgi:endonuclease YncB( thermonuclease family)
VQENAVTYRLLTGQFVIRYPEAPRNGPEPDGDTIKFRPDDPSLVEDLGRISGTEPDFSRLHRISLRFEAVDALETHFAETHQELTRARAARDHVLAALGFRDVVFRPDRPDQVASANADQLPGWILTNGVEGNGRLVSFVFTGPAPQPNGAEVFLDGELMARSVNADLLRQGLAYPMFYTTLPADLRTQLTALSTQAREGDIGLWAGATGDPDGAADLTGGLEALQTLVLWPKLFRRLVTFYAGGNTDLADFDAWLRANPRDRDDALVLLDTGELGNMHDVVTAATGRIRLNRWPDTFVVLPDPATTPRPAPAPSPRAAVVKIVAALVDPTGTDAGAETVSLLNTTEAPLDLSGWVIADASGAVHTLDFVVAAGDVRRVTLRGVRLANTGDTILVRDPAGTVVDRVTYTARAVPAAGRSLVF